MIATVVLAFLPVAASPESEGVSSAGLNRWIDACEREIDCLHGFVFLRHGKVVAEGSWKPFDTLNEPHFLSSHTKCFTTTAIGMLAEDGKLDLDERVMDVLPDLAPARPSERLRMLRVRDLMTMNTGWKDDGWTHDVDGDWGKAIVGNEFAAVPGQQYKYHSGGTHVLGMVVARRSGKPFMTFLRERLFDRLGIEKVWTSCDPQGNPCAGWGFNMTTREISLMGQLHLQKGLWNGERLLSEAWVELATAKHTWSGKNRTEYQPKNDWLQGFGFSWWRCQHGCYRADGSGGQYTIVFPKHDAVLSIHADVPDMQRVLDVVWKDFLPVLSPAALPEDAAAHAALRKRCADLALKPVAGRPDGADASLFGRTFELDGAPTGMRGVQLDKRPGGWTLRLTTDAGAFDVPVGFGRWEEGEVTFSTRKHQPLGWLVGVQRIAASAAVQEDGSVSVRAHVLGGPRRIELSFRRRFFKQIVEGRMVGAGALKSR